MDTFEKVQIHTSFIKLDQFLKFCGAAETGGTAKCMVEDGLVCLNGQSCTEKGKKIYPGDKIQLQPEKNGPVFCYEVIK